MAIEENKQPLATLSCCRDIRKKTPKHFETPAVLWFSVHDPLKPRALQYSSISVCLKKIMWPEPNAVCTLGKTFEEESVHSCMQPNSLLKSSSQHSLTQLQQHILTLHPPLKDWFTLYVFLQWTLILESQLSDICNNLHWSLKLDKSIPTGQLKYLVDFVCDCFIKDGFILFFLILTQWIDSKYIYL